MDLADAWNLLVLAIGAAVIGAFFGIVLLVDRAVTRRRKK